MSSIPTPAPCRRMARSGGLDELAAPGEPVLVPPGAAAVGLGRGGGHRADGSRDPRYLLPIRYRIYLAVPDRADGPHPHPPEPAQYPRRRAPSSAATASPSPAVRCLRRGLQPGHARLRPRGLVARYGLAGSGSASTSRGRSSSAAATSTWPGGRCSGPASPPRLPPTTCSRPVVPGSRRPSSSRTRSPRPGRSGIHGGVDAASTPRVVAREKLRQAAAPRPGADRRRARRGDRPLAPPTSASRPRQRRAQHRAVDRGAHGVRRRQ